jgi:predicted O-linked N-acetylglucosamine transferase (SPINDLY family)
LALRQRMSTGHIADGREFTRGLEDAYRHMWHSRENE